MNAFTVYYTPEWYTIHRYCLVQNNLFQWVKQNGIRNGTDKLVRDPPNKRMYAFGTT
jgi:hypothetical protein